MRDFIQYHKPEVMGEYRPGRRFGIVTTKPVSKLLGDRIWLLTGQGKSRKYYLFEVFIVDEINPGRRKSFLGNQVLGTQGTQFTPPLLIQRYPWFTELMRSTRNFYNALQRIDEPVITELLQLAGRHRRRIAEPTIEKSGGGGFGDPLSNRAVEKVAVHAVTRHLKLKGWSVQSKERNALGYDVHCVRGRSERHVEVKGVSGSVPSFIITAGERARAEHDPFFQLCVVTNALRPSTRRLLWYAPSQIERVFSFDALSFIGHPRI